MIDRASAHRPNVDDSIRAWSLTGLGRAPLGEGQPASAVAPLEEALSIRLEKHAPPPQLGETRFNLARALWSRPELRPRALELATAARADLRDAPKALAELDAWQTNREPAAHAQNERL